MAMLKTSGVEVYFMPAHIYKFSETVSKPNNICDMII
jgi:hypothetical protein